MKRIQRRRAKDWTMPADTIYVGRPTGFGNPFIIGKDGTAKRCVELYRYLLSGLLCVSCAAPVKEQERVMEYVENHIDELAGKDLACWCRAGQPCHADVLLEIANG